MNKIMNSDEIKRCLNDADYLVKNYFRNKKYCMAYDKLNCSGKICNSHILANNLNQFFYISLAVGILIYDLLTFYLNVIARV